MSSEKSIARRPRRSLLLGALTTAALVLAIVGGSAFGASITSASFTGGAGTATVGGTLYAKSGAGVTLTVITSNNTKCVDVTGAHTGHQESSQPKSTWTFSFTSGSGDGPKTVAIEIGEDFNTNHNCTTRKAATTAAYVSDNTGPTVTGSRSPAPNAAGWNNSDVTITWTASDGSGSGVATPPAPIIVSQDTPAAGQSFTAAATDRVGNTGAPSAPVVVKLDKTPPAISGSRSPAANGFGWNNTDVVVSFSCSDVLSSVKSCTGGKTVSASELVTGTAVDNADNSNTAAENVQIDKLKPSLSGAPTASPNANGWYNGDVTIAWSANDEPGGSGIDPATVPGNSVIAAEGDGLTVSASVSDRAGNTRTADGPPVKIDRTRPVTTVGALPAWSNTDVALTLSPSDGLSGVASTFFTLDGGPQQSGTSLTVSAEGVHDLAFWSVDNAGNVEAANHVEVKIDKTKPTISHTQSPAKNANGWNRTDVTVTFTCEDALSGIDSCTTPQTVTSEGLDQLVLGTGVDRAGNSVSDPASVSVDKTDPTIAGAPDRPANAHGWYDADVTVSFTCGDALSGIDLCAAPVTLGEGFGGSATGSAADVAGNTASATVGGIKIDKTAPLVTGAAASSPNGSGWYKDDVVIAWSCSDALSGLDGACPGNSTIAGEGSNLSASASAQDKAGNIGNGSVGGINIDRTAPTTVADVPEPLASGWYAGPVQVTLNGVDPLSGVEKTYYTVDGGPTQEYGGPFMHGLKGAHTIVVWSVDKAGNLENKEAPGHAITLKIDGIAPTISGSRAPAGNGFGWNNGPVAVIFECSDAESGIADCIGSTVLAGEGAGQSVSGTARDNAGNESGAAVDGINIDLTPPTLAGAPTVPANAFGWHNENVTIEWTADDALSGVDPATVPADSVITGEGDNLGGGPVSVSDKAGNTTSASVTGIKIDRTAPSTTATVPVPLASGWYAGPVQVELSAADQTGLSGVDKTYYKVDDGHPVAYDGPFTHAQGGIHTLRFWSVDKAGNAETTNALVLKIDDVEPTIAGSRAPAANGFGWNNSTVTVHFECSDAQSGIEKCEPDVPVSNEGADQSVTGSATDNAGNTNSATVGGISIDKTAPMLIGTPTTDANGAGWYKGDVTIAWTAEDGLSGVDPSSVPGNSTITGEGTGLSASASVKDKAGNAGNGAVTGVKIDRSAPVINGGPTTSPNAAGWYSSAVLVAFNCTDNLSGVASCPSDQLLDANGANQSVTSAPATDLAGNVSTGKTVGGINIDGLAPQTAAAESCTAQNNWCKGSNATVALQATDQAGLSGVKEIHYVVNGGQEQVAAGASVSVNVPLAAGSGTATVQYWAVDVAGNVEAKAGVSINFDNLAPTVTHTVSPNPNAADWNHTNATVHFEAVDDLGGSGVDPSTVTPDQLVGNETAGVTINGKASDYAGNEGKDSVVVKLDKTPPTISGAATTSQNANGWYGGPVTVHFTCADALSQVAVCPDDVTLTANGAGQAVTREAVDYAGNKASETVSGINIDREAPSIALNGIAPGGLYTLGAVPAASCSASDDFSGVSGGCVVSVTGGLANGVGTFAYTAMATDRAGNKAELKGTYRVIYRWDGFLQPINDTAHQVGASTSVFKAGSSVPAKFQLRRADGSLVQSISLPEWLTPAKGAATSAAVDETVYSDVATSGTTYTWDGESYHYNWKTAKTQANFYWRVGVKLDDGQTYFVNIGVR